MCLLLPLTFLYLLRRVWIDPNRPVPELLHLPSTELPMALGKTTPTSTRDGETEGGKRNARERVKAEERHVREPRSHAGRRRR